MGGRGLQGVKVCGLVMNKGTERHVITEVKLTFFSVHDGPGNLKRRVAGEKIAPADQEDGGLMQEPSCRGSGCSLHKTKGGSEGEIKKATNRCKYFILLARIRGMC